MDMRFLRYSCEKTDIHTEKTQLLSSPPGNGSEYCEQTKDGCAKMMSEFSERNWKLRFVSLLKQTSGMYSNRTIIAQIFT